MNARLLEIVKQSGLLKILTEHAVEFGTGTFIDTPYPEVEKFAELVIAAYTPPPHPIYLASDGRFYDIPQRQKQMTEDDKDLEIARLREALRYEANRFQRIGTHSPDCWKWGPQHYECAMRYIKEQTENWSAHD